MSKQLLEPPRERDHVIAPAPEEQTEELTAGGAFKAWRRGNAGGHERAAAITVGLVLVVVVAVVIAALNMGGGATPARTSANTVPQVKVPAIQTYNPAVPPVAAGNVVEIKLVAQESLMTIAPGVAYHVWNFNGSVPGPVLHVRQGQIIHFTLVNQTTMAHSIDFHAASTPWSVNYQPVLAGKSFSFTWRANFPGVFMYHCGTSPVMEHIANGMYGMMIVDPAGGWGAPAREYALVQSEFYTAKNADGSYTYNRTAAMAENPDYVVFNGVANQYRDAPLTAKVNQHVRLFVLNAGPSQFSAFHVIGAMFDTVYGDGNPANKTVGNQTITIAPGGGAVVELMMPEAGLYPFVTHSFADASKGALGVIKIG